DLSHLAMNGAGPIHDWEFALVGATTESVARYIQTGEFGLWQETGRINDAIVQGARAGLGLGEAIGRAILDGPFPHKDISVLAAARAITCRETTASRFRIFIRRYVRRRIAERRFPVRLER